MQLNKKNIHMEDTRCTATTQVVIEEDIIVSDHNPDVRKIICEKGSIRIEEIKATKDYLQVKGSMCVDLLYLTESDSRKIAKTSGMISFEESLYMEGLQNGDHVQLHRELEYLTVGMINPRKLSVQACVSFAASVDDVHDLEAAIEVEADHEIICKHRQVSITELFVQKKDIFRMKEECELPRNYPNILTVLWEEVNLGSVDFTPVGDKVLIQGEAKLFLLYEGDGEEVTLHSYESVIPFQGEVECTGSLEDMILDVDYQLEHGEVEIRQDYDGEERVIGVDMALELFIRLYHENVYELLEDAYGVEQEVVLEKEMTKAKVLQLHTCARCKIVERIHLRASMPKMVEICNSHAQVELEDVVIGEDGLELAGKVKAKLLYSTGEEMQPYQSSVESIPFSHVMDAKNLQSTSHMKVKSTVAQVQATMLDGEEVEVKVLLLFQAIVWSEQTLENVISVGEEAIDPITLQELPSMVVYLAKEGDTLWDVGKRYYTPLAQLRERNGITGDLQVGDKLLVVKSMANKI